ncbi:MAG: hypothetical protein HY303_19425 [Candidatus Wallbacteria bacterium]|nr:hypothetical protein [Candidatus Wallbacteria bacterium]
MSLIGFLLAAVLLSVVLIPLFMLFQSSRQTTSNSINSILASQLITTQIEKLKAMPFRKLERYIVNPTRPVLPDGQPDIPDIIGGPFESDPETPDIVEEGLFRSGGIVFDRLTYIAYFPHPNPDPGSTDFFRQRQRIRIRVLVRWNEPGAGNIVQDRKLAMSSIVQNENYHPKPTLGPRF